MAILKLIVAFFLSVTQLITPYLSFMNTGIDPYFETWSKTDKFTRAYAVELEKKPEKDFVILNLGDVQHNDSNIFSKDGDYSKELITKCVERIKPDLITLTGDNASGEITYLEMVKLLDSFNIPWAPVMGNHDGSNGKRINEAWDSYVLLNAKNCLFKFGPRNMGYGNYIINITENGKIIHSLFMMDTHSDAGDTAAGVINYGKNPDGSDNIGYDHFWANQLDWYEWAVKGISDVAGKTVESTVFMHIPVYEYRTARDLMCDKVNDESSVVKYTVKSEFTDTCFGTLCEGVCSPEGNNGFFDLALRLGSTKNMLAGHDHTNDLSLLYNGIRLSYTLKSGKGSYWNEDKLGVSLYSINSDGNADFYHYHFGKRDT